MLRNDTSHPISITFLSLKMHNNVFTVDDLRGGRILSYERSGFGETGISAAVKVRNIITVATETVFVNMFLSARN